MTLDRPLRETNDRLRRLELAVARNKPAAGVDYTDTGGGFGGGVIPVSDVLDGIGAGTMPTSFLTVIGGGKGTVYPMGNITGTATVDLADGNAFTATLTGNVTVSTTGWTNNKDCQIRLSIAGGAGGFLPTISGVTWTTTAPGIVDAGDTLHVVLWGDTGGTVIWGAVVGDSGSALLLVVQEVDGSPAVSATEIDFPNGSLTVAGTVATPHLLASRGGERAEVQTIAASGAAQTLDLSLYNTFDITLTANCTLTFSNPPPSGVDAHWTIVLRQGGVGSFTVTWPGTVDWQDTDGTTGGAAPTLWTAVGAQDTVELSSTDGGTSYGGALKAHGGGSLTVEDDGTPLATGATTLDFAGAGVTATGAGAEKTITIPGGATASDTGIWRPQMDSGTGMVIVDGATGEAIMGFGPA